MSGALFSRIKIWGATDTLTAADLNAEFDNILNNFSPQEMAGYSATVMQMQTQTSPGGVGSESLATSLSGEIERLRFQIAAIIGSTYWYQTPAASIAQLVSALGTASLANKVASGLTNGVTGSSQPIFLQPDGTTNTVRVKGSVTPLVYSINGSTYTISTDVSIASLTVAPNANNTCVVADSTIDNSARTKLAGENGSLITVATMGSSVSALTGQIAAFKTANATAEYFLCRIESSTQLTQVFRGYFFGSTNSLLSRQTLNNADSLTLMKLTWIFATTSLTILPVYTNPRVSGTAPTSPAIGDYWFDMTVNFWKTYNGTQWVSANATLVGICIQDTTKTVGARSQDFFNAYSDINTLELINESTTEVRTRYAGGQVNVYGSTLNYNPDFARWDNPTNNDSGVTVSASNYYYLYINTIGNTLISDIAPLDRRGDLRGYYHPANTYRCLGIVYTNASGNFDTVESFYSSDLTTPVSTITAAVANFPLPYGLQIKEQMLMLDASGGAFTQNVPPPYQWKGHVLTYIKKDTTYNKIKLQAWGDIKLTTTGTVALNGTTITTMASTTGLTAGNLVYGPGIAPGTTITGVSAATATISQAAILAATGATYVFSNSTGMNGFFRLNLATQFESISLFSDGTSMFIMERYIPNTTITEGPITVTSTGSAPTKGTMVVDRWVWSRVGSFLQARMDFNSSGTGGNGSGLYLFAIPQAASLTIDTNKVTVYTGTDGAGITNNLGSFYPAFPTNSGGTGLGYAYDTTHVAYASNSSGTAGFFRVGGDTGSAGGNWFGLANSSIKLQSDLRIPITDWEG